MKILVLILLIPWCAFSQIPDSLINKKWINYNRKRVWNDDVIKDWYFDKKNLGKKNDTISRQLTISISNELLEEKTIVNGAYNGLSCSFWPNGILKSLDYYVDNKLWESISRSDSSGHLLNPGTLANGIGTVNLYFSDGKLKGTETYSGGVLTGPYSCINLFEDSVSGDLTYKPSVINFLPSKKVKYINSKKDTVIGNFLLNEFEIYFGKSTAYDVKAISVNDDSLPQISTEFPYLNISFVDPAVIPTGHWTVFNLITKKVIRELDYDESGNAIKQIIYTQSGKKEREFSYPPCRKRKIPKSNPDGSFYAEVCN